MTTVRPAHNVGQANIYLFQHKQAHAPPRACLTSYPFVAVLLVLFLLTHCALLYGACCLVGVAGLPMAATAAAGYDANDDDASSYTRYVHIHEWEWSAPSSRRAHRFAAPMLLFLTHPLAWP